MLFAFQESDHTRDVVKFGELAPSERDRRGVKCRTPCRGRSHNQKSAAESLIDDLLQSGLSGLTNSGE